MLCPKYEGIGSLRGCTILPNYCHSWHRHAFWSCEVKYKPFSLSCASSSQAELLVMCDMKLSSRLVLNSVLPQILWYCVQGYLYVNLWLMYNYFSRSLILTICIQHSSLFCIMGKCAAWWNSPPQFFMAVSGFCSCIVGEQCRIFIQ